MTPVNGRVALVVGGAGFVGSTLVRALLREGAAHVIVVDNLLSSEAESVPVHDRVQFREGSIVDDEVLAALPDETELIFHLATFHGNQSSIADPLADHENNTLTTLKLLERAKDLSALERIVYASAGCTVAEKTFEESAATAEDAPVSLWHDSPYQISKIVGELYANYYLLRHRVPTVKARFQNVFGPGEVLGAGRWRGTPHTIWRNVTPTFVYKALKGEALPVERGGMATRDFIYVDDIVAGLLACAERGEPGGVYNLASGVETSIRELAELINDLAGNATPIALSGGRDWDRSGRRHGDPTKARAELGFEARTALADGLERTIAWTRENLDWIESCMLRHEERMRELAVP